MSELEKTYILRELQQLRQIEANLQTRFGTLSTAKAEARLSFLTSLSEWQMRALVLDDLLDSRLL
jgi:hypothetical protein